MLSFESLTRRRSGADRQGSRLLAAAMFCVSVLAATLATGCSEGDARCLFGCECESPADCEDRKECTQDLCQDVDGVPMCAYLPEARGTNCSSDGGRVCDGAGNCVECNAAEDCPDDGKECTQDLCQDVDGVSRCNYSPAERGVACSSDGGRLCDGAGNCVECNEASDCPNDGNACTVATCQLQSCGMEIVDCPPVLTGSEYQVISINTCNDPPDSSVFRLGVDYEDANGDVTQGGTRLFVDACFSTGGCVRDQEADTFNVLGDGFSGSVESDWCIQFGEETWVDMTIRISDAAGNESNPQTERILRPPGAN